MLEATSSASGRAASTMGSSCSVDSVTVPVHGELAPSSLRTAAPPYGAKGIRPKSREPWCARATPPLSATTQPLLICPPPCGAATASAVGAVCTLVDSGGTVTAAGVPASPLASYTHGCAGSKARPPTPAATSSATVGFPFGATVGSCTIRRRRQQPPLPDAGWPPVAASLLLLLRRSTATPPSYVPSPPGAIGQQSASEGAKRISSGGSFSASAQVTTAR